MKSTDERVSEVLGRARAQEAAARRRRQRIVAIGGGALSVVAVIAAGIGVASVNLSGAPMASGPFGLMGSVFSDSSVLGNVVVGFLGLVLGVAVTMLANRLGGGRRGSAPEEESAPNDGERKP